MKVTVSVMPKQGLLDPQGAAVQHALQSRGLRDVQAVQVGKLITLQLEGADSPELRARLDEICRDLLSNPVIEDYRYEVHAS